MISPTEKAVHLARLMQFIYAHKRKTVAIHLALWSDSIFRERKTISIIHNLHFPPTGGIFYHNYADAHIKPNSWDQSQKPRKYEYIPAGYE